MSYFKAKNAPNLISAGVAHGAAPDSLAKFNGLLTMRYATF